MKEVFISRHLDRWGRRFEFVRFFAVENEVRLEKELDQIYIDNMKLYVNIPRYKSVGTAQKGGASNATREVRKQYIHEPVKLKSKEVWREKKRKGCSKGS